MDVAIPGRLVEFGTGDGERRAWVESLPELVREVAKRWSLSLGAPFDGEEASCSWVAHGTRADGSAAVLKVGFPHMESRDEGAGLAFWAGEPTVRLLDEDEERGALLLERCEPGSLLSELQEPEQDLVLADLLPRLWRPPPPRHVFRPLAQMAALWAEETRVGIAASSEARLDRGLVNEGLRLWEELPDTAPEQRLLATDLHAGNVLRAQRRPWLVIDPKPFVGDPAYDATQHVFNCDRVFVEPRRLVERLAALLGLDAERVRLWTLARAAAEWPRPLEPEWRSVAARLAMT